ILPLPFVRRELGEMVHRHAAGTRADLVDDAPAHERADSDVAVMMTRDGVPNHRIDADETRARRNANFALRAPGATKNMREAAHSSAGDGDLVHAAAGRADHVILRHLRKPRDTRRIEL